MPLTAAKGGITIAEHVLAQTIAACTEFQTLRNVATAELALPHVYFHSLPPPANGQEYTKAESEAFRPFALVSTHPLRRGYRKRRTSSEGWADGGNLYMAIERNVPAEFANDDQELMRQWGNTLGKILERDASDPASFVGLCDLSYQDGYLAFDDLDLEVLARGQEKHIPTQGDFLFAQFLISWGVR